MARPRRPRHSLLEAATIEELRLLEQRFEAVGDEGAPQDPTVLQILAAVAARIDAAAAEQAPAP
jgi:hypothetical protein